jgi:AcrR family transcriptional regulator
MSSDRPEELLLEDAPVLPRGRHNLSTAEVRSSQRARLLAAMLELVGERGYAATTVPDVVARARVSRNAFYDLFEDKLDCFLALADELAEQVLAQLVDTGAADWVSALRAGLRRYLSWWQQRPVWTRAYLVELPAAGPRALEQRDRQYARFIAMFEALAAWARREQPSLPPLRAVHARMIVLVVTELVAERVRHGDTAKLMELEPDVLYLIVLLLADEPTARRVLSQ